MPPQGKLERNRVNVGGRPGQEFHILDVQACGFAAEQLNHQLKLQDIDVLEIDRRSSQLSFLVPREHGETVVSIMHECGLSGIQGLHEVKTSDE